MAVVAGTASDKVLDCDVVCSLVGWLVAQERIDVRGEIEKPVVDEALSSSMGEHFAHTGEENLVGGIDDCTVGFRKREGTFSEKLSFAHNSGLCLANAIVLLNLPCEIDRYSGQCDEPAQQFAAHPRSRESCLSPQPVLLRR